MSREKVVPTATHWGAYRIVVEDDRIKGVLPFQDDPDPSPIGRSLIDAIDHPVRIGAPMIRKGWLKDGPGRNNDKRGDDPFVETPWDEALDIVAEEIKRVRSEFGNESIFAGAYGWASAGRFHHAQSQLRRFLNLAGGHTNTTNSYSFAAAEVIVPHVTGNFWEAIFAPTTWDMIAKHTDLVVAFGGWAMKNNQVNAGGMGVHGARDGLLECRERGVSFVYVGPTKDDMADFLGAEWLQPRPTTDMAVMLALAYVLYTEGLHDKAFLDRYCVGFDKFVPYLTGESDGVPKSPEWAERISTIPAETIASLARRMAGGRTLISSSWSLQRQENGEQPYWMNIVLAAMLGQIGLPGGGFGFGYGAVGTIGYDWDHVVRPAALPVPPNAIETLYPVARIADMLLNPGGECLYDGQRLTYPDIRMVYWCGGNPYHHHQDLNRLLHAWRKPETIIVHEPWWTATARRADIVLPCTTTLERNDFTMGHCDRWLMAMHQVVPPHQKARNEYDIFADLADRLGFREEFTLGRDEDAWLRAMWDETCSRATQHGYNPPDFDTFWEAGAWELPRFDHPGVLHFGFRNDPEKNPLLTPSGKIEIYSEKIASFGLEDVAPHPAWREPREWLGAPLAELYPLHLISNQPKDKLHSQLDFGANSRASRINGRTGVSINTEDARARGIEDGALVRLFNGRGACLASAIVTDRVQKGVLVLPTGAWFDPESTSDIGSLEVAGNPNVLTQDIGTSSLAQGSVAQSCLVEIERFEGAPPALKAHLPPTIEKR
ncbi:MAG: molybdopterin-dependent oxidoreductase [Caulobacterales bacterium]|nr:molybdopterin-dependent oxidoreductase [Caulobacterales bacterium]